MTLHGRSPLPASTYPCFGTLLTGRFPSRHLVRTTASRPGAIPGWAGQPHVAAPTLFDVCRGAGLRTAAIQGDHLLLAVLNADRATVRWPPGGEVPPHTPVDAHGYPTNAAVRPHLLDAAADPGIDFLFGQLNEGDTLGHDYGPNDPATRAAHAAADRIVGEVLDALASCWGDTLVVIVSDHGMEPRTGQPPIDLLAAPPVAAVATDTLADGGAALVHLRDGVRDADAGRVLHEVPGVEGWSGAEDGVITAAARPGWIFSAPRLPARGYHGGPATAHTFAAVAGGHPVVPRIARALGRRAPHLADWAPTIAQVLSLDLPETEGRSLLED